MGVKVSRVSLSRQCAKRQTMTRQETYNFLLGTCWHGWRRWVAWLLCVGFVFFLGGVRSATEAEFSFASLALLPVLLITWLGGRTNGLIMALVAASMWALGDFHSDRVYRQAWIPWANALAQLAIYSLVAQLTTIVRQRFQNEHECAHTDALTQLPNRRAFLEAGEQEIERSSRYRHPIAVIFLDLDDFKALNDTRGHEIGDCALRATAKAIRGALRASDVVARMGGDEFAILLPETPFDAAGEATKKIAANVKRVLKPYAPADISIGMAWYDAAKVPFPEMLKAADALMYQAKQDGKGKICAQDLSADPLKVFKEE